MLIASLQIIGGFLLLLGGGEFLVRGAVGISKKLGFSPLLIGLTVVAFSTSAPELLVSFTSALKGQVDLSIGNVVGSNIVNILFILGVSALITPIMVKGKEVRRDSWIMVIAAVALTIVSQFGIISRPVGLLFFAAIVAYVFFSYRAESKNSSPEAEAEAEEEIGDAPKSLWVSIALVLVGLVALVFGSDLLVQGATAIALAWGVSEAVIGLTIVAIGTSLPELAASVISAIKGHSEMAIGNVVGSNIFNIFSILGLTAMVKPIHVNPQMAHFDMPVMIVVSLILTFLLVRREKLSRFTGVLFILAYVAYAAYLYTLTV